jgi:Zn-dependent membrane protease YugP
MERSKSELAIEEAEAVGGTALSALAALVYAIFLFVTAGFDSNNGWILTILGILTLTTSGLKLGPFTMIAAYLLGGYQLLIIGLFALGLAISEQAGWGSILVAAIWAILGWRCVAHATKRRRLLS